MNYKFLLFAVIIIVIIIAIITIIICAMKPDEETKADNKEPFYNTSNGGYVSDTGAIRGNKIFTDHMMNTNTPQELIEKVNNDQYYAETGDLGAVINTENINNIMKNHNEVNNINRSNANGVMTEAELNLIDKKIKSSAGNQTGSFFNRAGAVLTELTIAPDRVRGIVNKNYIPDRGHKYKMSVVGSVVPVHGYDIPIDRIPAAMSATTSSRVFYANSAAKNKKAKVPSEASLSANALVNEDTEEFKRISNGYIASI